MRVVLADRAILNGYTIGVAEGLRNNGVDVQICGPAKSAAAYSVIPIFHREAPSDRPKLGRALQIGDVLVGTFRFHRLLATRPDLIHLQWPTALDAVHALTAKRMYHLPLAYTVHNFERATDSPREGALQNRLIRFADLVFTHGPSLRGAIVQAHPHAAPKTHVVEYGNYEPLIRRYPRAEARATLGLSIEGPLFVFVGQLRPRKGVHAFLTAFAEYYEHGGTGRAVVAGTATVPSYERQLRQIADRCGTAVDWLTSDRPLPGKTLDLALSAASQVVLPFEDASQSGSLILAMTHGRCVVSTAVGEVPRTLRGRGLLIRPGDHPALVEALSLAERDSAFCDDLGRRARQYALTRLAWPAIGARTAELYRSALPD